MRRNVKAAVIAALIVTGANAFTMVSATTVESHTDGKSIGLNLWGEKRHYTDDLTVNVSGLGVMVQNIIIMLQVFMPLMGHKLLLIKM